MLVPDVDVRVTSWADKIVCPPVVPCEANVIAVHVDPLSAENSAVISVFITAVPASLL